MSSCFLYKISNTVNDKVYIGITKNPKVRKYEHFYGSRSTDRISLIKLAIDKHGPDKFSFEVLCEGTREYIVDLEMKAIRAYDSISNGYNIRAGGEDCGSGHKIENRSDDEPLFVTGFWFPNRRTCLDKLTINPKTIYNWKQNGTLGDIQHLPKDSIKFTPVYVAGFWFDSLLSASILLNKSERAITKRVKEGFIEQKDSRVGKSGSSNHMTGRTGHLHHNSKAVYVDDVLYGSIAEAARETNYTKKMIYLRLKNQVSGFFYKSLEE